MASAPHYRTLPFLLSGLLIMLSACSSTPKPAECDENQGIYLNAQEQAPLTVPAGVAAPDKGNVLAIPAGNGKSIDKKVCLQQSPSYFGTAGRIAASPEEMVADWAQAWADRNSTAVLAMYSPTKFTTDAPAGAAAWLEQRGTEVANGPMPNGRVTNLKITQKGDDERVASFTQTFSTSSVRKELQLVRDAGLWKISGERVISAEPATTTAK
ncbi:MAG: hypothetical protein QM808_17075 [Steroidobacteraceae bacterium]